MSAIDIRYFTHIFLINTAQLQYVDCYLPFKHVEIEKEFKYICYGHTASKQQNQTFLILNSMLHCPMVIWGACWSKQLSTKILFCHTKAQIESGSG